MSFVGAQQSEPEFGDDDKWIMNADLIEWVTAHTTIHLKLRFAESTTENIVIMATGTARPVTNHPWEVN